MTAPQQELSRGRNFLALFVLFLFCAGGEAGETPNWKAGDVFRVAVLRYGVQLPRGFYVAVPGAQLPRGFYATDAYVAEVSISGGKPESWIRFSWKSLSPTGTFGKTGIRECKIIFHTKNGLFDRLNTTPEKIQPKPTNFFPPLSLFTISLYGIPMQPIPWCSDEELNRKIDTKQWHLRAEIHTKEKGATIEKELRVLFSNAETPVYRVTERWRKGGKWWLDRYEYLFGRLVLEAHLLPPAPPPPGVIPKRGAAERSKDEK